MPRLKLTIRILLLALGIITANTFSLALQVQQGSRNSASGWQALRPFTLYLRQVQLLSSLKNKTLKPIFISLSVSVVFMA